MAEPDLSRMPELLRMADLVTPMAVRATATLRLVDHLRDGPVGVVKLAELTRTRPRSLGKLLAHLTALGLLEEPRPGEYVATGLGALLASEYDELGLRPVLDPDHVAGRIEMCTTSLVDAVRTGGTLYEAAYGIGLWEDFDSPGTPRSELAAFALPTPGFDAELVAHGYDWSGVGSVIDVGGSIGALLTLILHAHPHLSGTLLDLPSFAELGRAHLAAAGLAERTTVVGGSFFDPLPAGADVYLLSGILPDWDDEHAVRLLRRCAEAAGDHGRVLVAEIHLHVSAPDPVDRTAAELRIEVSMENPDRTVDDVVALAAAAGLVVTRPTRSSALRSILELRPEHAAL